MLFAYPSGSRVPAGNSGDGGTPCSGCHRGLAVNPSGGKVELVLPEGSTYRPGVKQTWTVRITDPDSSKRFGFQLTVASGNLSTGSNTVLGSGGSRPFITHSSSQTSYTFDWTPPSTAGAAVAVWVAGLATRGTSNGNVYTATATLAAAGAVPTIRSAAGVVNGASFTAPVAPGSWVTIFGDNLAPAGVARIWRADEIVNGQLPLSLEGTRVRINGRDAAIYYVSPTQLNVQAPDDASRGAVSVEVTTASGTSTPATVTLQGEAPAFFRFEQDSGKYAASVHAAGGFVGPLGTAAKPGEVILLFGTGFGATQPAVAALQVYEGAAPLRDLSSLHIRIGGVEAVVQFAGLSGAGLYQFNVVVPDVADGDQRLEAEVAGTAAGGEAWISVKR
jgi:uncharacterized protein (TIGR03437 family)